MDLEVLDLERDLNLLRLLLSPRRWPFECSVSESEVDWESLEEDLERREWVGFTPLVEADGPLLLLLDNAAGGW